MSQANENSPTPSGKFINANGLSIYYEDYGSGEPLVLLHGGLGSSASIAPLVPAFSKHFRVLTPDTRGHGKTDNPSGEFSYRLLADDLAEFIQLLGISQPFVCGWSDGGQTALELGMNYPRLAKGLVVGAAWFKFSERYQKSLRFFGMEAPGRVSYETFEKSLPQFVEELQNTHEPRPDAWKKLLKEISVMWCSPLGYTATDFARISIPTLILVGDRDTMIPVEEAVEMYRLIPGAELAIAPNAEHVFPFTDPDTFSALVLGYLLRHRQTTQAG